MASELDSARCAYVLEHLHQLGTQVFLTAIDAGSIDHSIWSERRRFHVEHGRVEEMIY
jgi:recombinational DNA repair ATPase RecF